MTETPKCPYCGAELEVTHAFVSDATAAHKLVYTCFCRECGVYTPKRSTLEEVLELGKDEDSIAYIESRRLGGCGWYQPCAIIFDSAAEGQKNEIHFYEPGNELPEFWPEAEYGKSWRCWHWKPTQKQMAAAKWEE